MLTFNNENFPNGAKLEPFIEFDCVPRRKFVNCNFGKVDLNGVVFGSSHFENCIFNGSIFTKSLFSNCQFRRCKITNCNFTRAELEETIFTNCSFEKSNFAAAFIDTCKFELTTFTECNLDCMLDNVKIKKENCGNWIDIKDFSYFMNR